MHAAAYRALNLGPHTYEAIQATAADLPALVRALRDGAYDGFNVTVPHKRSASSPTSTGVAPSAEPVGAGEHASCAALMGAWWRRTPTCRRWPPSSRASRRIARRPSGPRPRRSSWGPAGRRTPRCWRCPRPSASARSKLRTSSSRRGAAGDRSAPEMLVPIGVRAAPLPGSLFARAAHHRPGHQRGNETAPSRATTVASAIDLGLAPCPTRSRSTSSTRPPGDALPARGRRAGICVRPTAWACSSMQGALAFEPLARRHRPRTRRCSPRSTLSQARLTMNPSVA